MKVEIYESLPVKIEAIKYNGKNVEELKAFGGESVYYVGDTVFIDTLEGEMMIKPSDYLVKGIEGEFYGVKGSIFRKKYRKVGKKEWI